MPGCWPFFWNSKKVSSNKRGSAFIETTVIKLVVIGQKGVGKTSLINRYLSNCFTDEPPATKIAWVDKEIHVAGKQITVRLWERSARQQLNLKSPPDAFLICVNLSDTELDKQVFDYLEEYKKASPTAKIFLVGTKSDKIAEQSSATKQLIALQKKYKLAGSYLVSAKNGEKASEMFEDIRDQFALKGILTAKQQRYWTGLKAIWNSNTGNDLDKAKALLKDYAKSDAYIPSLKRLFTFHWRHHAFAVTEAVNKCNDFYTLVQKLENIKTKDFNNTGDLAAIIIFLNIKAEMGIEPRQSTVSNTGTFELRKE